MRTLILLALSLGLMACRGGHHHHHGEHDHHSAHHGVVAAFPGGFVELKLHDDKGDLELWLGRDRAMSEPFDLPLDTEVTVVFLDRDGRAVKLAVRDRERNEDEDGTPNLRDGKTHYFIFPGDSGEDASWLQGKGFKARVEVRFGEHTSEPFELVPHSH